jgi:hypothetical protein
VCSLRPQCALQLPIRFVWNVFKAHLYAPASMTALTSFTSTVSIASSGIAHVVSCKYVRQTRWRLVAQQTDSLTASDHRSAQVAMARTEETLRADNLSRIPQPSLLFLVRCCARASLTHARCAAVHRSGVVLSALLCAVAIVFSLQDKKASRFYVYYRQRMFAVLHLNISRVTEDRYRARHG